MTVTDKDAKQLQKMFEKLEKQSKKDKENQLEKFKKREKEERKALEKVAREASNEETEASIGSFFKSCLSSKEKQQLEVEKKDNKVLDFKDKK